MPKTQRSPEEIEAVREEIMGHALELIATEGFDGFSMRKLAVRLNIAAKTIYNYFHNQDELYLGLLTKGFQQLHTCFEAVGVPELGPEQRLAATIRAYVDFGFAHANIYNLMFTWHVPKYNDYAGTPMEPAARVELTAALRCADFFMARLQDCLGDDVSVREDDLRFEMIRIWSQMHGYIAGINNNLLDYMHPEPLALKERMVDRLFQNSRSELLALKQRCSVKIVS